MGKLVLILLLPTLPYSSTSLYMKIPQKNHLYLRIPISLLPCYHKTTLNMLFPHYLLKLLLSKYKVLVMSTFINHPIANSMFSSQSTWSSWHSWSLYSPWHTFFTWLSGFHNLLGFCFFFLLLVISSQFPWLVPRFLPNLLPRPTLSPWSFSFIHLLTLLKESHSL